MPEITPGQITAFRLRSHHLTDRLPADRLVEAVRDSGGIQAQVTWWTPPWRWTGPS